jgi:hypothetical protein
MAGLWLYTFIILLPIAHHLALRNHTIYLALEQCMSYNYHQFITVGVAPNPLSSIYKFILQASLADITFFTNKVKNECIEFQNCLNDITNDQNITSSYGLKVTS